MSFFTSYLRPTMCPGVEANYGIRGLSNIKVFFTILSRDKIQSSAAHFSCLKFFAKNEKNGPVFREKRKIRENASTDLVCLKVQLWLQSFSRKNVLYDTLMMSCIFG